MFSMKGMLFYPFLMCVYINMHCLFRRLQYIAEELNSTEKDYVASLKYIITVSFYLFLFSFIANIRHLRSNLISWIYIMPKIPFFNFAHKYHF